MKEDILEKFREDENFVLETEVVGAGLEPIWGIVEWLKDLLVIFITSEGLKHSKALVQKLMKNLEGLDLTITLKFASGRSFELRTSSKDLEKDLTAKLEEEKEKTG